jgi:hypothetical protein
VTARNKGTLEGFPSPPAMVRGRRSRPAPHAPPDGHDPEILRAEAEIARTREAVALSVAALQREISRAFEWRELVRQRPILAIALAFGVGALLGRGLGAFRHRRR